MKDIKNLPIYIEREKLKIKLEKERQELVGKISKLVIIFMAGILLIIFLITR